MNHRPLSRSLAFLASALLAMKWFVAASLGADVAPQDQTFDIVVYGGTSSGVAAAVEAARLGKRVVLVEPSRHIGGLTTGGLGATDIGNKQAIGGISREFYQRVFRYYQRDESWKLESRDRYMSRRRQADEDTMWTFEPHAAEAIMRTMLDEVHVPVVYRERLDLAAGVERQGTRIVTIRMESGRRFAAKMFIDASYEGDLLAKAGVRYHVGREASATYGESLNGVQLGSKKHQFLVQVDPYRVPGDANSGLLPGIHAASPGEQGAGDKRVQAYNFRMCLTDSPEIRVPFPKPTGYDPLRYELLLRTILAGQYDGLGNNQLMPNHKTDTNNHGAFSTDDIGMNYDFPEGDYATRERIFREHVEYQQGLMWFLANDPRLPERVRADIGRWGLARDEFVDHGNWPHQLYVREARRMISDLVMRQQHCQGNELAPNPVGLAAYGMDSHNVQRYVKDGYASNEGDVQVHGFHPYPIGYQAIVPKAAECENLLVPVCLSATHIAYGSIRMEPVFMVLGHSAAAAACQAIDRQTSVQAIDLGKLREKLLAEGQVLEWTGPKHANARDPKQFAGIVVDDAQATFLGEWTVSQAQGGFLGDGYRHDGRERVKKEARFSVNVPKSGKYEVRLGYLAQPNRASNVPVTVEAADGPRQVFVNERREPRIDGLFEPLGEFPFEADKPAVIVITNRGVDGYVIVDGVQLVPVER